MLGVLKNKVILMPHSKRWAEEYRKVQGFFMETFAGEVLRVEHVGSTAIPGIMAKPILDVAVVLKELTEQVFRKMEESGYTYYGEPAPGKYLFILRGKGEKTLQHVHCYKSSDLTLFYEQIQFRDFLRTHSEYAREYEQLKMGLSLKYFDDRKQYTAGKQEFFDQIKTLAAQDGETGDPPRHEDR